jgi:hypothetical protein
MSHGGLPSKALSDAINAAYERGIAIEQAFRVVEDYPHAPVDLLRSTRRHRHHADDDVLVARDVLPESSGALRGLTKTSAVKPANCFRTNSDTGTA